MIAYPPPNLEINPKSLYNYEVVHHHRTCDNYVETPITVFRKFKTTIEYSFQDLKFKFNADLESIVNLLKQKESILTLENDWDDMGSPKISVEAWKATAAFLFEYSSRIYNDYKFQIDVPRIFPSSDGSIDIQWETETYGIVINIESSGESATYYADNKRQQMCQGVFNPRKFESNLLPKAITL